MKFVSLMRATKGEDTLPLPPTVLFHVAGLLGAVLLHYGDYELEELVAEIKRVAAHEEATGMLHGHLVALGIIEGDVG
jgi:hypothetical protein